MHRVAVVGLWLFMAPGMAAAEGVREGDSPWLLTSLRFLEPGQEEKPPPKLWCGGIEFGLSGAQGNTENFKVRLGAKAKRENAGSITTLDLLYNYGTANENVNENRALFTGRHEWLFGDSPWSIFATNTIEADEFQAYDLRVGIYTGLGYRWLKTERTLLKTRIGFGGSWEFGGPENAFRPEALLGLDFEHRFSERSKVCFNVDVFPDLKDFGEYRVDARAAYELLVDPDLNLTLRLGVLDRYDSTPEGKKPNDVEYFAVLLWKF